MERWMNGVTYLMLTCVYSSLCFISLLPEVKNILYSRCVWKFSFIVCNKFFGIEAAYRLTLVIVLFYFLLSMVTINCRGNQMLWYCQDSCFTKFIIFLASNTFGFLFPFSRLAMEFLYNLFLFFSLVFITIMFFSMIDFAHAFRTLWLKKAQQRNEDPTCYLCTWLFLIHLTTAVLYALSLDLILAFFFFNKFEDCINTIVFLCINICLCMLCYSMSYFPNLRDRETSSQVIFATILFCVVFVTWLALSDPENEYCNMYGTIFTGSILESSTSFRSLASLTVICPTLLYHCFKKIDSISFTLSLLWDSHTASTSSCLDYSKLHIVMATASSFVLMSVTNFYEPVHSVVETSGTVKRGIKTSVIYFEGNNRVRFLLMCTLSVLLPASYLLLLALRVSRICCKNWRKIRAEKKGKKAVEEGDEDKLSSVLAENEFLYIPITEAEALKQLKSMKRDMLTKDEQSEDTLQYLLLQCFYVKNLDIYFWNFPRYISQTYFKGRNGSNACTVISMIIGRFFSRSDLPYQNNGYLSNEWMNLFYTAIEDGNFYYDTLVKEVGVLDLSIEEVYERLGTTLNVTRIYPSLPVSFESDVETVTIFYQLQQIISLRKKLICLFIHKKRTSSFLIYENGDVIYADSHAFGGNGALMICAKEISLSNLLGFLKELLGNADNRLATLTVIEYEKRWNRPLFND